MLPTGQGGGASHQRGGCISSPAGRLYGFRRQRRHLYWRPKGAHLASAAILYNSRGRSTQPACKASADHRQNPWRPGPKARRRHQPSRPSGREGLREYRKAPPRSRSRSRPRRRRLNPQAPQGLVHKKSALRDWFYESYGQRTVVSPPRERRPFAPKGRVTSPPAH